MDQPESFGVALKRQRVAAGLTQEELAERAGLSARAISALERGVNHTPRRETMLALLAALPLAERERATLAAAAHRGPLRQAQVPADAAASAALSSAWQPATEAAPFVGRTHELAIVERHLAGVGPPALLLAAEPGMGKTRLLREAAVRAPAYGLRVLAGGCLPQSRQEPYAPIGGALETLLGTTPPVRLRTLLEGCGWLVRLLPELATVAALAPPPAPLAPEQERRLMFRAVARFIANCGGAHGSLLLLDDLQWAGHDALDLLVSLVHAAGDIHLRLILAYREGEGALDAPLGDALAELAHARLAAPMTLGPLAPDEAGALLRGLLGQTAADARTEALLRRAGGVPFFLVSCAQHESEHPAAAVASDDAASDDVPWDVAQSVRQRVGALPRAARALLEATAMAGREVARPLVLALGARLGQSIEQTLSALDALHQVRLLLAVEPDVFAFAHDLVREAVEADVGPGRRIALHRWIAEALEEQAAAADEPGVAVGVATTALLAHHFQHAGLPQRAVPYLEQLATYARAQHAHAEAAQAEATLARALEGLGRPRAATAARVRQGQALLAAGRYDEALAVLGQALADCEAARDGEGLACAGALLGEGYVLRGTPEEGIPRLKALLPLLESDPEPNLDPYLEPRPRIAAPTPHRPIAAVSSGGLVALHVALAWLINATGRYADALGPAERAAALAAQADDPALQIRAALRRGQLLLMLGRLDEGVRVLEPALALAEAADDLSSQRLALNSLGWVHEAQGDCARDQEYTEQAFAVAERMGDPTVIAFMWSNRGGPAYNCGDWHRARQCFERGLALMRQLRPSWASAWPPLLLGQLDLAQGRAEAPALLAEAVALAAQSGDLQALRQAQCALAERDLLAGQPAAAHARLASLGDRASQPESDVRSVLPLLAWACLDLDQLEAATTLAAQAVARARAGGMRPALIEALRVSALIAVRLSQPAPTAQAAANRASPSAVPSSSSTQHTESFARAAHVALDEALALSQQIHAPYAEARVSYTLGLLHLHAGELAPARQAFLAAGAMLARLSERLYAAEVERALTRT